MSRDMDAVERIRAGPAGGGKRPEDMSPQELHAVLWQVLTFRDSGEQNTHFISNLSPPFPSHRDILNEYWVCVCFFTVVKKISKTIEKIPGLGPLIEKIMDGISGM